MPATISLEAPSKRDRSVATISQTGPTSQESPDRPVSAEVVHRRLDAALIIYAARAARFFSLAAIAAFGSGTVYGCSQSRSGFASCRALLYAISNVRHVEAR